MSNNFINFSETSKVFFGEYEATDIWYQGTKIRNTPVLPPEVPTDLLNTQGYFYDPYYPNQYQDAGTSTANPAGLGDSVGLIFPAGYHPFNTSNGTISLNQTRIYADNASDRPVLTEIAGRRGWSFDGVDDALWRFCTGGDIRNTLELTAAFMVHSSANTSGVPFEVRRGEYGGFRSVYRPIEMNYDLYDYKLKPIFNLDETIMLDENNEYGSWGQDTWDLVWTEIKITAWDTANGGSFYTEINGIPTESYMFTPSEGGGDDGAWNRQTLGFSFDGLTKENFWNGTMGRYYWGYEIFNTSDKNKIKNWLQSTTYV